LKLHEYQAKEIFGSFGIPIPSGKVAASPEEAAAYAALSADHDNFRASLAFGIENGHEETAARTAAPLAWYWWAASDNVEALEWLRRVLPTEDRLEGGTRAELLAFTGLFTGFVRGADADDLAARAVTIGQEIGDPYREGLGHMAHGFNCWVRSEFDASQEHLQRMLECGIQADNDWMIANAELLTGFGDRMMSRLDAAAERTANAEIAYRRSGQPSGLGWVLSVGGQIARYRGDFETEVTKQREAREIFERQGAPFQIAFTLINEAISLTLLDRADEAIAPSRLAVAMERELTLNDQVVEALSLLAWFEHEAGNLTEAFDLYEESARLLGIGFDPYRMQLTAAHLTLVAADRGSFKRAAVLDGFASANQSRPEPAIYTDHWKRYREMYRTALGDECQTTLDKGKAMDPPTAQAYMLATVAELRADLDG